jgi:eukaryotic-like serine/threonine-protein kinase
MPESSPAVQGTPPPPRSNILGRYRAFAKLARGGMADIYLAIAEGAAGVSKIVVIKRMRGDIAVENEERFNAMFYDEARLTTLLNHPNIVQTYEVGEDQGALFMVMEYAEGHTLQDIMRLSRKTGAQMTEAAIGRLLCDMLNALHYAHELKDFNQAPLNIVHRDVSPQNVVVGYDGRVRLIDFGIAKASMQTTETEVGTIKGKIRYMAPEQVAPGAVIDRRTDVFACGVVLWELLTRQRLFSSEMTVTSLVSLVNPAIPVPRVSTILPDISPALDAIVGRALEKSPEGRYQTAIEMRKALDAYLRSAGHSAGPEDIGEFVAENFAEAREKLGARVRAEFAASQAEPDSKVRSVAKLETLADLRNGPLSARDASIASGGTGSASGSKSLPDAVPANIAFKHVSNPRLGTPEAPIVLPGPASDRRVLVLGGIAVMLLGAAVAVLLAILTRPAPAATPPTRTTEPTATAVIVDTPKVQRAAVPALPTEIQPAPLTGKEPGFLNLVTTPSTKVTIDGKPAGTTPLSRVALPPGNHTVLLDNAAQNIHQSVVIVIKSTEVTAKDFAFRN